MQLRKSLQRSNTVKLFCYLISRRITCGTLFAQGFAKTKQTWKSSNPVMGHKDIQTTMDVYAEATEQKKQESFESLAAKLDIF